VAVVNQGFPPIRTFFPKKHTIDLCMIKNGMRVDYICRLDLSDKGVVVTRVSDRQETFYLHVALYLFAIIR
jgi:hypothetical protein